MEEIWKDIKGYEGLYQISNMGRVKSLPKKNVKRYQSELILKLKNNKGYLQVNLYNKRKMKAYQIHRLVAENFLEKPKLEVNHKNGIKSDNSIENLEWVTPKENMQHAWNTGLMNCNRKRYKTRVRIGQYALDGKFIKLWNGVRSIEDNLGFSYSSIINCCRLREKTSHGYI